MHTTSVATFLLSLLAGADAANSSGCGKSLPSGISTSQTNALNFTTKSGSQRSYRLHLPSAYSTTTAHPLIFSFHGRSDTDTNQERISQLSDPYFNPHGIAVYPQGINEEWQGDPDAKTDDITFTLELADYISQTYCVDNSKWYSSGKSNGGGFTVNILACNATAVSKFAAFAGVASADYQAEPAGGCNSDTVPITCNPGKQGVPILENHGLSDGVIPYPGGDRRSKCLPSIPHFMTAWSQRDGYGTSNTSTNNYDGISNLTQFQYGGGKNVHYRAAQLGHQWPSTLGLDGGANYNITKYIMEFFSQHSL